MPRRKNRPPSMVTAARDVRLAMTKINDGIHELAASAGLLIALMDNADEVQTLTSTRSDTCYQLVGNLGNAYHLLADFLTKDLPGKP